MKGEYDYSNNHLNVMKREIELFLPPISHAPADTYLLSLLIPHKESWGWISSNFVNILIREKNCWDEFYRYTMWAGCPYILETTLSRDIAENIMVDFIDFVRSSIDAGYCVYTSINRNPIKIYNTDATNLSHNPLIYGYDDEKKVFLVAEFFPRMVYSFKEIPYKEIEQGFWMFPQVIENHPHKKTHLVKFYNNDVFHFSSESLRKKLQDHIESKNLFEKFHQGYYRSGFILDDTYSEQFHFGLKYYDFLKKMVFEMENVYIRPFQLLVFRNYITKFRLEYLERMGIHCRDKSSINENFQKTEVLRNMVLKLNTTNNGPDFQFRKRILEYINIVKETDRVCCEAQIDLLSKGAD